MLGASSCHELQYVHEIYTGQDSGYYMYLKIRNNRMFKTPNGQGIELVCTFNPKCIHNFKNKHAILDMFLFALEAA